MIRKTLYIVSLLIANVFSPALAQNHSSALFLAEGRWELIPNEDFRTEELEKTYKCGIEPLIVSIDPETKRYSAKFGEKGESFSADIIRYEDLS